MKPVIQRMVAPICQNIIFQSLNNKEKFHCWLSSVGSKHAAAIIKFDQGLKLLLKDLLTAEAYTAKLLQLTNDNKSGPLVGFLNIHSDIEKYLTDHLHIIEEAAVDFIVDHCVNELDKNIDYRIVDQIKVQQRKTPHPPPDNIKIAPLPAGVKKESEGASKISPLSFIATNTFVHCLENTQEVPISLEQLSVICKKLLILNQQRFFDYLIRILSVLAKDDKLAEWICSQCQQFDFKSDTPDHYEFIERCITIQLPLLLHCSNEVLENFSATLMRFSTLSYYKEFFAGSNESPESILASQTHLMHCWKYIYRQLKMKAELREIECIQRLIANLEVFLVDISDDLQDIAEPVIAENDSCGTQTDSAPSSQDMPPGEEYGDTNDDISMAIRILDNAASDPHPTNQAKQSEKHTHWSQHHSLHHNNRKRAYSATIPAQQPTADVPQTINTKIT